MSLRHSSEPATSVSSPGRAGALALVALSLVFCQQAERAASTAEPPKEPRGLGYLKAEIVNVYPHDPRAWTQGLLWHEGWVYQSTGHYGRSAVQRLHLEDGSVESEQPAPPEVFGEGLARNGGQLVQVTWREQRALRYELETLEPIDELPYEGDGWGLCFDGRRFVRSDGSATLFFHRADDFTVERRVPVHLEGTPQANLNELECVGEWVYANVWTTDQIVRIDPKTGRVSAVIDASGLLTPEEQMSAEVLNGIAYRPETDTFLLTGKNWPKLFEVVFVEATESDG